MFYLGNFAPLAPRFRKKQEEGLLWLVEAHVQAERVRRGLANDATNTPEFLDDFRHRMEVAFRRFGATPPRIRYRSHEHADFNHFNWPDMEVFRLSESASGHGMASRMKAFQRGADRAFTQWYETEKEAPDHLIHVSCTGYLSPSAAQKEVAQKGWLNTEVTHVYHMGCYAAFPAVRVARGLQSNSPGGRVDIAHTEFCTLHLNPGVHEPEHIVMQSLFADGLIRYSLYDDASFQKSQLAAGWKVLALHEEIVPDSTNDMTWILQDWGIHMTLSKDVPSRIGQALAGFQTRLLNKAKSSASSETLHYAIHPGGPRIIDQVQDGLRLTESQVEFSRAILADHGNMSSATLPHVWQAMLDSSKVKEGERMIAFAFGPGLTISGGLFEKVSGS